MTDLQATVAERAMWNRQHFLQCQERHRKLAMKLDAEYMEELLSRSENEMAQEWPLYVREG